MVRVRLRQPLASAKDKMREKQEKFVSDNDKDLKNNSNRESNMIFNMIEANMECGPFPNLAFDFHLSFHCADDAEGYHHT